MELVSLLCLWVVTRCGPTFADGNGPVFVAVAEKSDAILPCSLSTKENIKEKVFDWKKGNQEVFLYDRGSHYNNGRSGQDMQFKGRVSHYVDELKNGNASIKITNTNMADNGSYSCIFPNQQTSYVALFVAPDPERLILKDRTNENITGAAPKPYVTILNESKDGVLLGCEVHGTPAPHVEWQDKDGKVIPAKEPFVSERQGRLYIILQTTVTKAASFFCVATQNEIKHKILAEIYVPFSGAAPETYITFLGKTDDGVQLECSVRAVSPQPKLEWQDSSGNILPAKEPNVTETRGTYSVILQTTVTKTDHYRCIATQEEINRQVFTETYVSVSVSGTPIGLVIACAVFPFLLVVPVFIVLVKRYCSNRKKGLHGSHE